MKQKLIYLFSLMLMCILGTSGALADDVYKFQLNGQNVEIINGTQSSSPDYFSWNTAKHNFNTKFNGCTYDGVTYSSGLKYEGATQVNFTTTATSSTVVIVQSTWSDKTLKFDGTELAVNSAEAITGARVYTISDVEAGAHSITRGSGESGIFAVTVTEATTATTAPTFTTDLSATADVTVGVAETFTVATDNATSYQWYVGGTAVSGATSASYEYTATEAGDVEIYCVATNSVGSTNSTTCTVTASAPAVAPTITTNLESAYNVQKNKTLTLSIVAENASSYQWYMDDEVISGATSDSYTFTAGSTIGATNDIYCAVTNAAGTTNSVTATITTTGSNACKLTAIQFSNTAYGAIAEADAILETAASVTVPYMAGTSAPTVVNASVEVSEGATFEVGEESITVTAEDEVTSTTYAIVATAITPLAVTEDIATTSFSDVPSWIYNHYGYDGTKGVKFAKAVNDATPRITLGNTRQYYFVEAAKTLTLTSGTSSRAIKVYRNGTQLSAPTASGASGSTISIDLDESAPCMIMIESNQTGGDGGFTAYAVTAATAPAFTTDLSATASATVGTAKTFTVAAEGATSYQWYTCDDAEGTNAEAIEGETSASYEYTAAAEGTEYIFCAATNSVGTTNSTVCAVTATEEATDDYNDTAATFSWTIGNENEATITGTDVEAAVKSTKVKVGSDLVTGTASYADPGSGTLVTYVPGTSNPGNLATDMIEYTIKMAKGTTFTPTSVSYDAVKVGTDNATYSWSYTVDGAESDITTVSKDDLVRNNNSTGTPALRHTEDLTGAEAGQVVTVRFYVSGFGNTKTFALGNIEINGLVNGTVEQRTFTDFQLDFQTDPYTVMVPSTGELPTGVTVNPGTYNGAQHGVQNPTISVAVDGPVKFTIGSCQYGGHTVTITNSDNETVAVVDNNNGCDNANQKTKYVTYTYNNETATTLTFAVNGYLPFFYAEACDYIESVDVKYYDVDGTTLIGTETVEGGSDLVYAYGADDVTVAEGKAFRGWFDGAGTTALKVAEGTPVTEDIKLYAKTSEIEVAEVGKIFNYDLRKQYFYEEDHEMFSATSHTYNGSQHGWQFSSGNSFSVQVAGTAQIVVGLCQYAADAPITVTDANNVEQGTIASAKVDTDGATATFNYTGEATTLTFTMGGTAYIHGVTVYNVSSIPTKDEATGYYIVESGDAAGLILAINTASAEGNAKIFLPNGIYDLGETTLTTISGNNVSIIGESMDGVIIKNRPVKEGIAITATLLNTATGTYMQDLTLDCIAPYGTGDDTSSAERGVCLQDKGNQTICKNVYLKGLQDSYYSNNNSGTFYFEDSKIEGTVDFICGNGDVYFNNTNLYVAARSTSSSAANVISAPNTPKSFGYIFYGCTIDGIAAQDGIYSLGRPWAANTIVRMINTTMKIKPLAAGWTDWSPAHSVTQFGEYNSVDANGNAVDLSNRKTSFNSVANVPVITEDEAATYTKEAIFGSTSWIPYEIAAQATVVKSSVVNNVVTVPEGIYLVEKDGQFVEIFNGTSYKYDNTGKYTLRMANERGGFGEAVEMISGAAAPVQDGETITLTVSANMNGYRAYVNTESNYTVDENTQVYLPVSKTNNEVNLEPIEIAVVPANMPVILVTTADANVDGTYTITLTTTDADATEVDAIQYLQLTEEGVAVNGYRLGYKASSGVKFYKYVASNPEPGKIYLNMSDLPEGTPSADALQIEFELEATGINEVGAAKAVVDGKFIKAGKLVIFKAGKAFNAAGATLK